MNQWNEFEQIRTPADWKKKLLERTVYAGDAVHGNHKLRYSRIAVIVCSICITVIIGATSALAYTLAGGDFFRCYFAEKAGSGKGQNYMDVDQLASIASSSIGTVVDTNELRIDIMDVLKSGNMMTMGIKVTAKQLDSVLYKTDFPTLQNYRFNDVIGGDMFEHMYCASVQYIYSDSQPSLADNQLIILCILKSYDDILSGSYSVQFSKFGYFTMNTPQFYSLYDQTWEFQINMDNISDHSKNRYFHQKVQEGEYQFYLENIQITPLTCMINYKYEESESKGQFEAFSKGVEDTQILLKDGTVLSKDDFSLSWGSGSDGEGNYAPIYIVDITFEVPVNIEEIQSVETFRTAFEMKKD